MQNNRLLKISTAGSRKATHWQENAILWSEFTEKLKMPVRSTETMEEYLAMPKSRQAELKVGDEVGVDLLEPSLFETCEREDEDR